jgi:hypothetical protein
LVVVTSGQLPTELLSLDLIDLLTLMSNGF